MRLKWSLRRLVLVTGLGLMATAFSSGCGSSSSEGQTAAQVSPEMQKKTMDMLKNYGDQYRPKNRAARNRPR